MKPVELEYLRSKYGKKLLEGLFMSSYTSARVGGPADAAIVVKSKEELAQIGKQLWEKEIPFVVIGSGSNLLVSDKGIRDLVLLNKAKSIQIIHDPESPLLAADSGTTMNNLAQKAAEWGMSGLEWAATIPGTLGGAVYGNAGAFGGDMAGNVVSASILLPDQIGPQEWEVEKLDYAYRSSVLKREHIQSIILSATLSVITRYPEIIRKRMKENSEKRQQTQPKGASMGSTFKNPPGDHVGHLLEEAGLKGKRIGNSEISSIHANFIINHGKTTASDIKALIDHARLEVMKNFGVKLELEIELIGEWQE